MKPQCVYRTALIGGKRFASICANCADKEQGDAWALAHGFTPSHGTCAACLERDFPGIPADVIARQKANEGKFIDIPANANEKQSP